MLQRIVPFVDHEIGYRLLQRLISKSSTGFFEIPAVVTTHENKTAWWPGVKDICERDGIPLIEYVTPFPHENFIEQTDWFLLISWKHILPANLICIPKHGILNLHYSLLPSFRGVYPINWAIMSGEHKTGFTYHHVTNKIDDGEIFMQVEIPILLTDTARTLQLKMDDLVCEHFDEFIDRLLLCNPKGPIREPENQPKKVDNYYSRKNFEKAGLIDLSRNYQGVEFFNLLRGMSFLESSKNAYIIDTQTGKKIYFNLILWEE